jgi:hypothetical protein
MTMTPRILFNEENRMKPTSTSNTHQDHAFSTASGKDEGTHLHERTSRQTNKDNKILFSILSFNAMTTPTKEKVKQRKSLINICKFKHVNHQVFFYQELLVLFVFFPLFRIWDQTEELQCRAPPVDDLMPFHGLDEQDIPWS